MKNPVFTLLLRWPDRQAVHADAMAADPDLDQVAVHRWFQRGSIPVKYWAALIEGSSKREKPVTADDLIAAHTGKREDAA